MLGWLNPLGYEGDYTMDSDQYLEATNETLYPAIRYRHTCKNHGALGQLDTGDPDPSSISAWTFPSRIEGRVSTSQAIDNSKPLTYRYQRYKVPKIRKDMQDGQMNEGVMEGWRSSILLFTIKMRVWARNTAVSGSSF